MSARMLLALAACRGCSLQTMSRLSHRDLFVPNLSEIASVSLLCCCCAFLSAASVSPRLPHVHHTLVGCANCRYDFLA